MYVLEAKPKTCAPPSPQIDELSVTKFRREHLGPNLTPCAKFGHGRFTEAGAPEPPIHVDFGFVHFIFLYFFSCFFDRATD
jgi:hypothetical protein